MPRGHLDTDPIPIDPAERRAYRASDRAPMIDLLPARTIRPLFVAIQRAMVGGLCSEVRSATEDALEHLSDHESVRVPRVRVLARRPRIVLAPFEVTEVHGYYDSITERMTLWLRTPTTGQVTSYRGFVNTLLHEFCHHLDFVKLGWAPSFHTRGFFARVDALYHHVLATPARERRPLRWIPFGDRWRRDWQVRARGR